MKTTDFYSSATGTLRVNGGRDENAPQGVSLSIDDLSYIKQGSRATDSGGTGTTDYNDLSNKPLINNVELKGNKSLNDLGIQPKIDSSHKVSADNIDDTSTTNKFATAAQLAQITTNQNNISLLTIKGGGYNFAKIGTNSYTGYGLTLTVANGVITISGTATGSFSLYLTGTISDELTADSKLSSQLPTQIAFTGAPDTDTKNRLIFGLYNDTTWVYSGSTNDLYHDLTGKTYNNWWIYLPIVSGNIYNGTWRPMIIDKTVYDSGLTDFQPYAPSNAELYAMIQALQQ